MKISHQGIHLKIITNIKCAIADLYYKVSSRFEALVRRLDPFAFKVKLVAVAKDEAAYLPEWIFHHLYFGFDHIQIFVNNTTDNTLAIADKFKAMPQVEFTSGDEYFKIRGRSGQNEVYRAAIKKSKAQGFTHIMFLDIDEFWTPKNFSTSIQQFFNWYKADIFCFEWLVRTAEKQAFLPAFDSQIVGARACQVKSMISTNLVYRYLTPHNVFAPNSSYVLADGTSFNVVKDNFSRVPQCECVKELKEFFVLHRIYRSEFEYISALGRGRPISKEQAPSGFKDNRRGYEIHTDTLVLDNESKEFNEYVEAKKAFISKYELDSEVELGKRFVEKRFYDVLEKIKGAPASEARVLKNALNQITNVQALEAYSIFKQRNSL